MTTWVKVLNSLPQNPKVLKAGDRATYLYLCGLCYSNEHLTDGFIAEHVLSVVAPGVKSPELLAGRLVDAGLWHAVEGGWQTHEYDEHQRTADQIKKRRSADAARKASERSNGSPQNVRADSARTDLPRPVGVRALEVEVEVESREEPPPPLTGVRYETGGGLV